MSPRYPGFVLLIALTVNVPHAGAAQAGGVPPAPAAARTVNGTGTPVPADYVVGAADVLSIVFWGDKDMSADVTVRPDGKISLPLLNEVNATGLTPEQLRTRLTEAASRFISDPDVAVVVKEIHSRNVFITGQVAKPANYSLNTEMTVMQLIAVAGGLLEYADSKNIVVMRTENGRQQARKFNYKDVVALKSPDITLKPNDTVVVPER
jgi:polysaccharide export outer membrane protein